ncbi:UDP-glucose 4-epimerase GalE [soil metagenome]
MNILVTGGAGYIGSVTVEALIARGHRVTVLDNLATGHRDAVHLEARFVLADITDRDMVGYAVEENEVEAVMHFAASSLVGESMQDPFKYFYNNSVGSLRLLETLLEHGVRKVVLSSTAALFGQPDRLPIPETSRVQPGSVYGESKHMIERVLSWLHQTKGLAYVTLRYFNAAGATESCGEDHRPETHLIPLVLQVAQGKREAVAVFGDDYDTEDGTCVRDYIHVWDLAQAHILAVQALGEGEARAYNLGNGQGFSVREVLEVCREVTGRDIPARMEPRRAGDPPALVADSSLIACDLGWRPEHPELRAIVASAWRWQQRHPEGYRG